ncbi:hypothetical protein IFM89_003538, partial [Coptis chinensis]
MKLDVDLKCLREKVSSRLENLASSSSTFSSEVGLKSVVDLVAEESSTITEAGIIIKRSQVIVMFWFLLFYFHFVVLGNGSVDDSGVKLPSSTNPVNNEFIDKFRVSEVRADTKTTMKGLVSKSRVDGVPEVRVGKELNKKDRVKESFQFMKALKAIENKSFVWRKLRWLFNLFAWWIIGIYWIVSGGYLPQYYAPRLY